MGHPYPSELLTDNRNELVVHSQSLQPANPLHHDLGLRYNDKLFKNAKAFRQDQVQLLQQSWEYTKNEFTADAFLNWVFHRNTGGAIGFTDSSEGEDWQTFMNDNMDEWIRNAVVHNALKDEENIEFFAERGMLPPIVGTGTIPSELGSNVRDIPSIAGKRVAVLGKGQEVLIFGRTEVAADPEDWIAVLVKGDIQWLREDVIDMPDGVNVDDLPVLDEGVAFEFDPESPFEKTTWFRQLVRHLR